MSKQIQKTKVFMLSLIAGFQVTDANSLHICAYEQSDRGLIHVLYGHYLCILHMMFLNCIICLPV